jgi:hypothetical protein
MTIERSAPHGMQRRREPRIDRHTQKKRIEILVDRRNDLDLDRIEAFVLQMLRVISDVD